MPITITLPPPGTILTPQMPITLSSDFIGPLPTNTKFVVTLALDVEFLQPCVVFEIPTTGPTISFQWLDAYSGTVTAIGSANRDGAALHMQAELVQGFTTIDSGTKNVTYDSTAGVPWQNYANTKLLALGGMTAEDHEIIAATYAGIRVPIPAVAAAGGFVLRSLGELLTGNIPPNLTNRHGSILVSGQGAISRGTDPFRIDALGFEWHWNTIPPIWGELLGDPDELERRVVQWRLIDQDDSGQLFQRDVVDSNYDGVRYVWGSHSPVTLEWYVTPGAVVELSFLVLALG